MNPVGADLRYRLLLDLDALFDTRMGTLLGMDKQAANLIVKNGYQIREWDDFETLSEGKIRNADYQYEYANRNRDTLLRSIITGLPVVINSYIDTLMERIVRNVDVDMVSITLNTFPYHLPGPDIQAMIECLGVMVPEFVKINAVRHPHEVLDPLTLKGAYDAWATYAYDDWLKIHHQALLFKRINEMTVILPKVHTSDPRKQDVQEDEAINQLDKHALQAMVMEEFIHLEHLPVVDFCFFTPGSYAPKKGQDSSSSSRA